eukprot:s914_g15.t1
MGIGLSGRLRARTDSASGPISACQFSSYVYVKLLQPCASSSGRDGGKDPGEEHRSFTASRPSLATKTNAHGRPRCT